MAYTLKNGDLLSCLVGTNRELSKGFITNVDANGDNAILRSQPLDASDVSLLRCRTYNDTFTRLYVLRDEQLVVYDVNAPDSPVIGSLALTDMYKVSYGGGKILVSGRSNVKLLDATTLNVLKSWASTAARYDYANSVISEDGTTILKGNDSNVTLVERVSATAPYAVISSHSRSTTTSHCYTCISKTGKYIVYSFGYNVVQIYNTITNTSVNLSGLYAGTSPRVYTGISFQNEDFMLLCSSEYIYLVDLANGTRTELASNVKCSYLLKVAAGKFSVQANDQIESIYFEKLITENTAGDAIGSVTPLLKHTPSTPSALVTVKLTGGGAPFKIEDSISETLILDDFKVDVTDLTTGELITSKVVQSGVFTIPMHSVAPVSVSVTPVVNRGVWKSTTSYALGDLAYSNNPQVHDWIIKCAQAGTSGTSDPSWQNTAGTQFSDGSVIWEAVEPITMPITKTPVIPAPV